MSALGGAGPGRWTFPYGGESVGGRKGHDAAGQEKLGTFARATRIIWIQAGRSVRNLCRKGKAGMAAAGGPDRAGRLAHRSRGPRLRAVPCPDHRQDPASGGERPSERDDRPAPARTENRRSRPRSGGCEPRPGRGGNVGSPAGRSLSSGARARPGRQARSGGSSGNICGRALAGRACPVLEIQRVCRVPVQNRNGIRPDDPARAAGRLRGLPLSRCSRRT